MAATLALVISAGLGYYLGSNHQRKVSSNNNIFQTNESKIITKSANKYIALNDNKSIETRNVPSYITNNEQNIQEEPNEVLVSNNENISQLIEPMHPKEFNGFNENNNYLRFNELKNVNSKIIKPSQIEVTQEKKKEPIVWALGGNVAPIYAYRNIQSNQSNLSTAYLNNTEKPIISISGGFNIKLGRNRWRIESGVYYKQIGQEISNVAMVSLSKAEYYALQWEIKNEKPGTVTGVENSDLISINSSYGSTNKNSSPDKSLTEVMIANTNSTMVTSYNNRKNSSGDLSATTIKQTYQYIEIPFILNYQIFKRSSEINLTGGFSANILFRNAVLVKRDNKYINLGITNGLNRFSLAGIIGISYEIPIVPKIYLAIEPRFSYYLNSINSNTTIGTHPYSMGLFSGVSYRF